MQTLVQDMRFGLPRTVSGVMPAGSRFPTNETQFWIPLAPPPERAEGRSRFWLYDWLRSSRGSSKTTS